MSRRNEFISKFDRRDYYAVIFSSTRTRDDNGYNDMGERMIALAQDQGGFLGLESVRDEHGNGITVSYWSSLDDIKIWKQHVDHVMAQELGRKQWYAEYAVRISKVMSQKRFSQQGDVLSSGTAANGDDTPESVSPSEDQ